MMSAATAEIVQAPMVSAAQRSPWHSPVPYLFGGLAAMLGLIAFALLILACSYWRLSGYLEGENQNGDRDVELGEIDSAEKPKLAPVFEEKFLVIMAGEAKPTFLATPMSSRASSFGSNYSSATSDGSSSSSSSSSSSEVVEKSEKNRTEKPKQGGEDLVQRGNMEENTHETSDQIP